MNEATDDLILEMLRAGCVAICSRETPAALPGCGGICSRAIDTFEPDDIEVTRVMLGSADKFRAAGLTPGIRSDDRAAEEKGKAVVNIEIGEMGLALAVYFDDEGAADEFGNAMGRALLKGRFEYGTPSATLKAAIASRRAANVMSDAEAAATLEQVFHDICDDLGCEYDNEAALQTIDDIRQDRDRLRQELQRHKTRGDNHAESLRGIAAMDPATEGERMKQWARDALTGYVGTVETTIKALMDELAARRGEFTFLYTNYRNEKSIRRVVQYSLRWGATEWHPKPQWLLHALDLDKSAERDFAVADMEPWPPEPRQMSLRTVSG